MEIQYRRPRAREAIPASFLRKDHTGLLVHTPTVVYTPVCALSTTTEWAVPGAASMFMIVNGSTVIDDDAAIGDPRFLTSVTTTR